MYFGRVNRTDHSIDNGEHLKSWNMKLSQIYPLAESRFLKSFLTLRIYLRESPRAYSSLLFQASTMNASKKRKREGDSEANPSVQPAPSKNVAKPAPRPLSSGKGKEKAIELESHTPSVTTTQTSRKRKIKKLAPSRPFPTVPTSVSATGPRSAHKEGKNYICLTRKTPLGMYLRRCKEVILNDGCVDLVSPYPYSFLTDHPKGLKHFI